MTTVRDEIRQKLKGKAKAALKQRKVAIELHCTECMGGSSRDAKTCETQDCFLWPHGFGRGSS